jgi:hypothetical protein
MLVHAETRPSRTTGTPAATAALPARSSVPASADSVWTGHGAKTAGASQATPAPGTSGTPLATLARYKNAFIKNRRRIIQEHGKRPEAAAATGTSCTSLTTAAATAGTITPTFVDIRTSLTGSATATAAAGSMPSCAPIGGNER